MFGDPGSRQYIVTEQKSDALVCIFWADSDQEAKRIVKNKTKSVLRSWGKLELRVYGVQEKYRQRNGYVKNRLKMLDPKPLVYMEE